MFIKKADTIIAVGGSKVVRFISLLVFFAWGTFTLLNVVVLATDPSIPKDLTAVRHCKGIFCLIWNNDKTLFTTRDNTAD